MIDGNHIALAIYALSVLILSSTWWVNAAINRRHAVRRQRMRAAYDALRDAQRESHGHGVDED